MSMTEHIPYVLGGKIVDRRYPAILKPNPQASERRNRTVSHAEWDEFCDEFETSMSWSRNWPTCFLNHSVLTSFSLWLASVVLLFITAFSTGREVVGTDDSISFDSMDDAQLTSRDNENSGNKFATEILSDVSLFLLVVFVVTMAMAMVQMSYQLQESASHVCQDYTERFQYYCGVSFDVRHDRLPLISSPWRSHQHIHRIKSELRSYIIVIKYPEEATSLYQNVGTDTSPRQTNPHKKQPQFSKHPQHPNDEMGEPPFFDVKKVHPANAKAQSQRIDR